jgi:hypothetical protein
MAQRPLYRQQTQLNEEIVMSGSTTQCHVKWLEQCVAAERIREHFGVDRALQYLTGEKLFSFVYNSERNQDLAAELPALVSEIKGIFTNEEMSCFLDELKRTKYRARSALGPQAVLRFVRIRQLLVDNTAISAEIDN